MTENIKPESGLNPEQLERNRLVEEHRQLDAEYDVVESKIDSIFGGGAAAINWNLGDESEISGLIQRRGKILVE